MILADTSVWIDYLRQDTPAFSHELRAESILMHRMVLGEIALGSLKDRTRLLYNLSLLPRAITARDIEVRTSIERLKLHGRGIGYVDAHLLTATLLTPHAKLWTRDKRLRAAADDAEVTAPYL